MKDEEEDVVTTAVPESAVARISTTKTTTTTEGMITTTNNTTTTTKNPQTGKLVIQRTLKQVVRMSRRRQRKHPVAVEDITWLRRTTRIPPMRKRLGGKVGKRRASHNKTLDLFNVWRQVTIELRLLYVPLVCYEWSRRRLYLYAEDLSVDNDKIDYNSPRTRQPPTPTRYGASRK